jgi:hypothetical protein
VWLNIIKNKKGDRNGKLILCNTDVCLCGAYSDLRRDIVSHKGQHHDNERLCGKDIIF